MRTTQQLSGHRKEMSLALSAFTLLPFALIILTSCASLSIQKKDETSASSSSVASESSQAIVGEDAGGRTPTTEEATSSGALAERFLPGGILEFGNSDAPVTLLIFTEHHCNYCREFFTEILPRLKTQFIDLGKLKVQIAMLTIDKYAESHSAALGFLCAGKLGKGYAMHQTLFGNPNKSTEAILSYAKDLGIDTKAFSACIAGTGAALWLGSQEQWAANLAVSVVPAFFLNGEKFVGLPYYPDLEGRIEEKLKEAKE